MKASLGMSHASEGLSQGLARAGSLLAGRDALAAVAAAAAAAAVPAAPSKSPGISSSTPQLLFHREQARSWFCPSQALAAQPRGAERIVAAGGAAPLMEMAANSPLPLRCAAAGALCNVLAASSATLQVNPNATGDGLHSRTCDLPGDVESGLSCASRLPSCLDSN